MSSIGSATGSTMDVNLGPTFLSQFLDTEDFDTTSEEHIICLFEVLDEVRGPDIVSQINYVMEAIIKTLASSLVMDPIQIACRKLVFGIARYVVHPLVEEEKKRERLYCLCMPLCKCLLGMHQSLVFGSALCLEALVDSASWRFASDDMVNDVCLKVAVALEEKPTHSSAHMGLAMVLAMRNSFIVEPYARSLIRSGLQILNDGKEVEDSHKQLSAIRMVNTFMKYVDSRSVVSELEVVIKELNKGYSDHVVRDAAIEAIETARMIIREKGSGFEDSGSVSGSNFVIRSNCRDKTVRGDRDWLTSPASPDSQDVYSSHDRGFSANSLGSKKQLSSKCSGNSVKRKLWKEENGILGNGFNSFAGLTNNGRETDSNIFNVGEVNNKEVNDAVLSGFMNSNSRRRSSGSTTSSSERTQSELKVTDTGFLRARRVTKKQANINAERQAWAHGSVSVSSATNISESLNSKGSKMVDSDEHPLEKEEASGKVGLPLVLALSLILLAVILSYLWVDNQAGPHLFPT